MKDQETKTETVESSSVERLVSGRRRWHRLRIGRCGAFVGLFRPLPNGDWALWRSITEPCYGKYDWSAPWFSGDEGFNELHYLPKEIRVHDAEEMKAVAALLGVGKYRFAERIRSFISAR